MIKKKFKISGMHCNGCRDNIENELKDKVKSIKVSFSNEEAIIEFDENKISEKEIKSRIKKLGYELTEINEEKNNSSKNNFNSNTLGLFFLIISILILLGILYYAFNLHIKLPELQLPEIGEKTSLVLLFAVGLLTGFHCISMCGGFVLSYTSKNAINGNKDYTQHFIYGFSKVISYAIIGGIFGLIGGLIAFSTGLRGTIAILAGIFMIFYALSMFGFAFFRKFQFSPKLLTKITLNAYAKSKNPYIGPLITGLLNGLFIACGPLQAMYLYAAGTGSFFQGSASLIAFGLGTIPIMIGFGSIATVISHKTTKKILKISAIIVLILGLIMINRGLSLFGSEYNFSTLTTKLQGNKISGNGPVITNGFQEINMDVDGSGYHPNSFVLKKGIPVKWNINVKELTSCNSEILVKSYNIDKKLQKGLNIVEFTPDKSGTIPFSCWMGMLNGNFIVTDSGTATTAELATSRPTSRGSCNMGSNGGGCGCGMMQK